IQSQVLADSGDSTSASQPVRGRSPDDTTPHERLLEDVIGPPEIVALILRPAWLEDIGRRHGAWTILRKPQCDRLRRKLQPLRLLELRVLHPLDHRAESAKALAHLKRPSHHLVDDIAPVQRPPGGEHPYGDHKAVRAYGPEDADPELIGARPIVRIEEQQLRN